MRVLSGDAADGHQRQAGEGADGAQGVDTGGGVGAFFGGGGEDRAEGDVVDGFDLGGGHLGRVVRRKANDGGRGEEFSCVGGEKIVLAEVQAGMEQRGVVGAVVDDEGGAGFAAEFGDPAGLAEGVAGPEGFVAKLEDRGAALEEGFGGEDGVDAEAVERGGVEDRVDGGKQLLSIATVEVPLRPAETL